MHLDDLTTFLQVVDAGGFTAAGRILDKRTKQVSRQIQRLEAEVDVALLHRTTRSISLTEAGHRLYLRAERILAEVREIHRELHPEDTQLAGRLRVVLPSLATVAGLTDWATTLRQRHPGIRLQVQISDQPLDLAAEGADLQIVSMHPSQTTFLVRKVSVVRPVLAAHVRYLERCEPIRTPADLSRHECLVFLSDRPHSTWALEHEDGRETTVAVTGTFQSSGSDVLLSALRGGLGVGACGPSLLATHPELQPVLPGWSMVPIPMYAVLPRGNRRAPLVEAFLDIAVDGLQNWF